MRVAGVLRVATSGAGPQSHIERLRMSPNLPPSDPPVSRRRFFQYAAGTVVLATAGGLGWEIARRNRTSGRENPFALDVSRLREVDPALVQFEPVQRFAVPRPDPRRMTIDLEDRLHVAAGRYVVTLDRDGNRLNELACAAPVRCVAVGEDGTCYIGFRDHLEVFDRRGQKLAAWDKVEGRPFLTGLALDANHVYIADSGNRLVWRHDRAGRLLGRIGERDPERNIPGLVLPSPCLDVVMARDGLLRVNNPGRHRVEAYTVDGHLEFHWGRASAAIDGFCGCCNPVAIEAMPDGRTITFEKGIPRVKTYSETGEFESVVAAPSQFRDPTGEQSSADPDEASIGGLDGAIESTGRVYVLDRLAQDLQGFEPIQMMAIQISVPIAAP
jgi:hypothetical protein